MCQCLLNGRDSWGHGEPGNNGVLGSWEGTDNQAFQTELCGTSDCMIVEGVQEREKEGPGKTPKSIEKRNKLLDSVSVPQGTDILAPGLPAPAGVFQVCSERLVKPGRLALIKVPGVSVRAQPCLLVREPHSLA